MTTATHTELMNIAKDAATYINRLGGECDTFEIEGVSIIVTGNSLNRAAPGSMRCQSSVLTAPDRNALASTPEAPTSIRPPSCVAGISSEKIHTGTSVRAAACAK